MLPLQGVIGVSEAVKVGVNGKYLTVPRLGGCICFAHVGPFRGPVAHAWSEM
jgi:hypothetical protein